MVEKVLCPLKVVRTAELESSTCFRVMRLVMSSRLPWRSIHVMKSVVASEKPESVRVTLNLTEMELSLNSSNKVE